MLGATSLFYGVFSFRYIWEGATLRGGKVTLGVFFGMWLITFVVWVAEELKNTLEQ